MYTLIAYLCTIVYLSAIPSGHFDVKRHTEMAVNPCSYRDFHETLLDVCEFNPIAKRSSDIWDRRRPADNFDYRSSDIAHVTLLRRIREITSPRRHRRQMTPHPLRRKCCTTGCSRDEFSAYCP